MPYNPKSLQNLKPQFFNENTNRGRKVGSRNRKTVVRELLDTNIDYTDLQGNSVTLSVQDAMVIRMAQKVLQDGDVNAYKELMDSIHGKIPSVNVNETIETPKVNLNILSTEELNALGNMYEKLQANNNIEDVEIIE